jgi:hypothetical protein
MDRITHQSPRQRGYGSTSSPRNDSLKHTRKPKKGREESNQEAKHTGSGGPSGQERRTVRTGHADRPPMYRGLSTQVRRTVRPGPRTVRQNQQNHQKRTPKNGPSAGSTRNVRQAPADRPPAAVDCPKPLPTKTRNQNGSKAKPSKNTKNTRKTLFTRTFRQTLADRPPGTDKTENSPTPKVNSPKSSSDFPNSRSCRDKGLGT